MSDRSRQLKDVAKKNSMYGFFRGIVEFNIDPLKHGRCKVRVPAIHSTEKSTPTEQLPWCDSANFFGGFHDAGSVIVPPVGATVWVAFEQGDPLYPVYFGTWWKTPSDTREMLTKTDPNTRKTIPERPISMGTWAQTPGPEVPQEFLASPYDPTLQILHKSVKGHTVLVEDRDGFEVVRIIDRSGQEIRMSCPIDDFYNSDNAQQRGTDSERDGQNTDYQKFAGGASSVEVIGTNGQGIKIQAAENADFVEIVSKDATSPLVPEASENKVRLFLSAGMGLIELVGTKANEDIGKIVIDLSTGRMEIKATSLVFDIPDVELRSEQVKITGDTSIDGDVVIRGDMTVAGDIVGG